MKLSNNGSESQNWLFSNVKIMLCIDGYVLINTLGE